MNIDDMKIVKNLFSEIDRDLTNEEANLLDRINTIMDFDVVQNNFNEEVKAYQEKMKALSEKAGE